MATLPDKELLVMEVIASANVSQAGVNTKVFDNVFHYRRLSTVNPVDKTAFETAFQATIMVPFIALFNAAYAQTSNKVRFLNDATDSPLSVTRAVVGGVIGDLQQNFDTVVFQLKTAFRGKSGRGSKHFGPMSAADSLGNKLVAGTITAFNAIKSLLEGGFADSSGNSWQSCIFSRKLSQIKVNPTTVVTNDVIAAILNATPGTMRRRKVKTITA